jgi:hypothetical protein
LQDVASLLHWFERSSLAVSIAEASWAFPAIEAFHVLSLTLVIGTVAVVDLRLLGLASATQRYSAVSRNVLPWTWVAFCCAATSGFLMFITQAVAYSANVAFRIKLVLLLLVGLNMLVFELVVARRAADWDRGAPVPWQGKAAALLSLLLWISIVFFGRRVGFTMILGSA